jgi:hypothetical protein
MEVIAILKVRVFQKWKMAWRNVAVLQQQDAGSALHAASDVPHRELNPDRPAHQDEL